MSFEVRALFYASCKIKRAMLLQAKLIQKKKRSDRPNANKIQQDNFKKG